MTLWIKDNGQEIELNDEDATLEKAVGLGWRLASESKSIDKMNKDELEEYARNQFGAELDRRKGESKLRKEVKALADGYCE
jgi:hypothetical protein